MYIYIYIYTHMCTYRYTDRFTHHLAPADRATEHRLCIPLAKQQSGSSAQLQDFISRPRFGFDREALSDRLAPDALSHVSRQSPRRLECRDPICSKTCLVGKGSLTFRPEREETQAMSTNPVLASLLAHHEATSRRRGFVMSRSVNVNMYMTCVYVRVNV